VNEDSVTWTQLWAVFGIVVGYLVLSKLSKRLEALEKKVASEVDAP
jgi:hypothetical protein